MIKKTYCLRVGILLCVALFFVSCSQSESQSLLPPKKTIPTKNTLLAHAPFSAGEYVEYAVRSFGLKVGTASLTFHGMTQFEGAEVIAMTFRVEAVNFFDEEKIYADPQTLYPLVVERDLNIWGSKEKIVERYDQAAHTLTIAKTVGDETTTQEITLESEIDNIYCFIYRYRTTGDFKLGDSFNVQLPTKNVTINLVKEMQIRTAGEEYDAFFMSSNPRQYKIWFDASEQKVPLKIQGSVGINAAVLTMSKYNNGSDS